MKNPLLAIIITALLFGNCISERSGSTNLQDKDLESVVLIGGSLISGMEDHGFFEFNLISAFPNSKLRIRNIGWPADDVFGLARSQFGSAQNTQSWQPPSVEDGFGSQVLSNHLKEADPSTLIIGYGPETAYYNSEEEYDLFCSGYQKLLDVADSITNKIILLSPPKQEKGIQNQEDVNKRNIALSATRDFIQAEAKNRGLIFIDLFHSLVENPENLHFTHNGTQLNEDGYKKFANILTDQLSLDQKDEFEISIDEEANIISSSFCTSSNWEETLNGVKFNIQPEILLYRGKINSELPVAIIVNGKLLNKTQETENQIILPEDSIRHERLINLIKEKNQLYRYRLRPLNEAYIYLFRRHEMGHLAYEMDDLLKLVNEKEKEIEGLKRSSTYDIEIELIRPWQPPKNYPEDEVPLFIPEPNITDELNSFTISDDYEISLFASDPMIANPINVNWDSKGRAWVATSSTYPHIVPGREPNDRIIILEDTNNDGKADKHIVFAENLLVPHSVMPVKGGAYVTATTQLLFLADTDGDDIADERRVIFDGFGNADIHHTIHGLRWTPWGDLLFTQSIYINSFVETAHGPKILNGSGIWKFRPEKESLTIFSRGMINPWGKALDKWGQSFATDGAGSSGINYVFPESAHATALGAKEIIPGLNSNTPKNTSAEVIYSSHFPQNWQGSIISNDFRANRTVRYAIQEENSGYSSEEVETVLNSEHRSYRPVDTKIGPDGALYIVDWYNPIIDHGEVDFHHPIRDKTHGRIWKLKVKNKTLNDPINMNGKSADFLLDQLKSPEQHTRIQANRAYVENISDPENVVKWINDLSRNHPDFHQHRIEGLWLLAALDYYNENLLLNALKSSNKNEKAAAVRLLSHYEKQQDHIIILNQLINDSHPQVRLETIHALREMGGNEAHEIAIMVMDHETDQNIQFALKYTLDQLKDEWIPKFDSDPNVFSGDHQKQLFALLTTEDSRILPHATKLLYDEEIDPELKEQAWLLLAKIGDAETKSMVLDKAVNDKNEQLLLSLIGAPKKYDAIPENIESLQKGLEHDSLDIRVACIELVERWKISDFNNRILDIVNKTEDYNEQIAGLRALMIADGEKQNQNWAMTSSNLELRTAANIVWLENDIDAALDNTIDLLETIEDSKLAERTFNAIKSIINGPEKLAVKLEKATLSENIASTGLKVVQTSGLNLFDLEKAIRKAGSITSLGQDLTEDEKKELLVNAETTGNTRRGREIYRRPELLCATCHTINNNGGLSGPNLSTVGSYMTPNSILESLLNPNTDIKQGYETVVITKNDGEIITGLLHRKTESSTIIRQSNSQLLEVPTSEISTTDVSANSLMPAGLSYSLHKDELKDLLAYLINLGN